MPKDEWSRLKSINLGKQAVREGRAERPDASPSAKRRRKLKKRGNRKQKAPCQWCGSRRTETISEVAPGGTRHARVVCQKCGKFIRWVNGNAPPKPKRLTMVPLDSASVEPANTTHADENGFEGVPKRAAAAVATRKPTKPARLPSKDACKCGATERTSALESFRDGSIHVRVTCAECGRFIKWGDPHGTTDALHREFRAIVR